MLKKAAVVAGILVMPFALTVIGYGYYLLLDALMDMSANDTASLAAFLLIISVGLSIIYVVNEKEDE